jgi:hypothetical protein
MKSDLFALIVSPVFPRQRLPQSQNRYSVRALSSTIFLASHLARHLTLAPHLRLLRWLDTEFLVDLRPVSEAVRG